jgi:hypothetical protein
MDCLIQEMPHDATDLIRTVLYPVPYRMPDVT